MSDEQCDLARRRIPRCREAWLNEHDIIFAEFEKMGFDFGHEISIPAYLVANVGSFSDPLCLDIKHSPKEIVDILTHELIHRLITDNPNVNFKAIAKDYPEHGPLVTNHILVHAIHMKIYLNLGWGDRLRKDIEYCKKYRDYKQAWSIVLREGPDEIIRKYIV